MWVRGPDLRLGRRHHKGSTTGEIGSIAGQAGGDTTRRETKRPAAAQIQNSPQSGGGRIRINTATYNPGGSVVSPSVSTGALRERWLRLSVSAAPLDYLVATANQIEEVLLCCGERLAVVTFDGPGGNNWRALVLERENDGGSVR